MPNCGCGPLAAKKLFMKSFIPHTLPLEKLDWSAFVSLIGKANAQVARFDSLLRTIPNTKVLLSPLTTNEAVLSSRIEGTQATLEEVFRFEADPKKETEKYDDIQEIINYRKAMLGAVKELKKVPLSGRIIKNIHKMLLSGVRGKTKTPGKFRTGQVFIGSQGGKVESASFVPPEPQTVPDHFSNFEKYLHFEEKDVIVQLAIIHAQFEIIHPFWDGNGRTGRILLPLFLHSRGVISSPNFYLSEYFEKNRQSYYDSLNGISKDGNWGKWISYFLQSVIDQSSVNINKIEEILKLYKKMLDKVQNITHSQFTHKIVDFIFSKPWFDSSEFRKNSKVPKPSVIRILRILIDNKVLVKVREARGQSPALYIFPSLLKIVK